mgnify:CR=1 FL=1
MLTKKQLDLLAFIHKRVQRDGVPPSFDEMKLALDLRSKSGIHRLITALEERGFIRRLPHRAQGFQPVVSHICGASEAAQEAQRHLAVDGVVLHQQNAEAFGDSGVLGIALA